MSRFHEALRRVEEQGTAVEPSVRLPPAAVGSQNGGAPRIDPLVKAIPRRETTAPPPPRSGGEPLVEMSIGPEGPGPFVDPDSEGPVDGSCVRQFWHRVGELRGEIERVNGAAASTGPGATSPAPAPPVGGPPPAVQHADESLLPEIEPTLVDVELAPPEQKATRRPPEVTYVDLEAPVPTNVEIVVEDVFDFISEYASHLSTHGMFVGTDSPLPPGTPVDVHVGLKAYTLIRARGVVAWNRSGTRRATRDGGMAIRFTALTEGSRSFVERIIAGHVADGGTPFDLDPLVAAPIVTRAVEPWKPAPVSAATPSGHSPSIGEPIAAAARRQEATPRAPRTKAPPTSSRIQRGPASPPVAAKRGAKRRQTARKARQASVSTSTRSAYDRIIQRLFAYRKREKRGVVYVVSAISREGASRVARNIASALGGRREERVVLVDANFRSPSQHRALGTARAYGLTDVLMANVTLQLAVQTDIRPGLSLLPAGRRLESPSDLINGSAFRDIVSSLQASFDWVIVDCPPVTTCADAISLADSSGAAVLVLEAERTRREVAEEAKNILEQSGLEVLGVILNRRKYHIPGFIYRWL